MLRNLGDLTASESIRRLQEANIQQLNAQIGSVTAQQNRLAADNMMLQRLKESA